MNTIDFCFWLQGYFEMSEADHLDQNQTKILKEHLSLVFKHEIDPLRESETTTSFDVLNTTHSSNDSLIRC